MCHTGYGSWSYGYRKTYYVALTLIVGKIMKKFLCAILLLICIPYILTGCLVLDIEPELQNPFTIRFDGARDTLHIGENMTVTAIVRDEKGNEIVPDMYEWYLDGNQLSEGSNNVTVGDGLSPDRYTLDLMVVKDTVLSSESVGFEVVENP